jgi:hypothetical protein
MDTIVFQCSPRELRLTFTAWIYRNGHRSEHSARSRREPAPRSAFKATVKSEFRRSSRRLTQPPASRKRPRKAARTFPRCSGATRRRDAATLPASNDGPFAAWTAARKQPLHRRRRFRRRALAMPCRKLVQGRCSASRAADEHGTRSILAKVELRVLAAEPNWQEKRLSWANVTTPDNVAPTQRLRQSEPL